MSIRSHDSPHRSSRQSYPILVLVNHIMEGTLAGTASWLRNRESKVSYHYGIGRTGEVHQYVPDNMAAWHAGRVRRPTVELPHPHTINPNLYTLAVAWEGRAGEAIPEVQYQAGIALHRRLLTSVVDARLPLRQRVVGHSQIDSAGRPNCPGSAFPWARLYADLISFERVTGPRLLVEGREIALEMIAGRAHAPVRALLEALGYTVIWDESSQTVTARR